MWNLNSIYSYIAFTVIGTSAIVATSVLAEIASVDIKAIPSDEEGELILNITGIEKQPSLKKEEDKLLLSIPNAQLQEGTFNSNGILNTSANWLEIKSIPPSENPNQVRIEISGENQLPTYEWQNPSDSEEQQKRFQLILSSPTERTSAANNPSTRTPSANTSSATSGENLVGVWRTKSPAMDPFEFVFYRDGHMDVLIQTSSGWFANYAGKYRVEPSENDGPDKKIILTLPDGRELQTLFQITGSQGQRTLIIDLQEREEKQQPEKITQEGRRAFVYRGKPGTNRGGSMEDPTSNRQDSMEETETNPEDSIKQPETNREDSMEEMETNQEDSMENTQE